MKRIKNLKYKALPLICSVFMTSCSEDIMDRINKDNNHLTDVSAKLIVTDVMTSTAFSMVGGDISTYVSTYIEHEVGCHNQLFRAESRNGEPSNSTTFNNTWGSGYTTLKNALLVVNKCSDGGSDAGNYITKGIGEVLVAYNLALMTDMFGDIPWSEACDLNVSMTPKIDKQEAIYEDVFKYLDSAIENLEGTNIVPLGKQDFIYGGDKTLWSKAAHGLKARYQLRFINKATDKDAILKSIVENVDKSFASADEQMSFNIYTGSNINPLFGFFWARIAVAGSMSMYDKLSERNDPRANTSFIDGNDQVIITPSSAADLVPLAENGKVAQGQLDNASSIFCAAQTASTHLLSYHEICFIKAEALARLGRTDEAKEALKLGIAAAFENTALSVKSALASTRWGGFEVPEDTPTLTTALANDYFDNNVSSLFDANPLKEIMVQKYIAMFGANGEAVESYNDVRRLISNNEDFIELKNPNNKDKDGNNRFPLRLPYGNDDVTTNPNVNSVFGDGLYIYNENVWWAGGQR